jgi:hypothetical protein
VGRFGEFDDRFPDDEITVTREFGLSQKNTGTSGPQWQDAPVILTNQSFTVSARVHLDSVTTTMTVLAPKGTKQSPFYLGTRSSTVGSVTAQRFEIMFPSADADVGETYTHVIAPEPLVVDDEGVWHNLTAVYDAGTKQFKLYVNGVLKNSGTQNTGWNATGPMVVAGSWYTPDNAAGRYTDAWFGGIDDVRILQGAMTDAQVAALNAATES